MILRAVLKKSDRKGKKYQVTLFDLQTGKKIKTIQFGAASMSDYTIHRDPIRKKKYIARHSKILKKDGSRAIDDVLSPAFWSLHLLWNKPSLEESIKNLQQQISICFHS